MPLRLCHHIKTNGLQCLSPALKTGQWCFFHARPHQRHDAPPTIPARTSHRDLLHTQHTHSSPLNDAGSVQVALSAVINALASNKIDTKRATSLLYGLQLAASIAARQVPRPPRHPATKSANQKNMKSVQTSTSNHSPDRNPVSPQMPNPSLTV